MGLRLELENFEAIYHDTYDRTLRYLICNCANIQDVNDLLQETYLELYKLLQKKKFLELENSYNYIIGIAKIRMKKHYGKKHKSEVPLDDEDFDLKVPADIDVELEIIEKLNAQEVWNFVKQKNMEVIQVFYLYFDADLKISQIAQELNLTESKVKNLLYRTLREIRKNMRIEGDEDV